jgi:NAD(P)-dependent dehydrogenase (short-subunit alcohol dehydrogenase family)
MRAVAQDVGPYGVTCNAVLPGWTKTPMADDLVRQMAASKGSSFEETWREAVAAYPAQRPLDPMEIANTIAFLASDGASGINGEAVRIALGGVW